MNLTLFPFASLNDKESNDKEFELLTLFVLFLRGKICEEFEVVAAVEYINSFAAFLSSAASFFTFAAFFSSSCLCLLSFSL